MAIFNFPPTLGEPTDGSFTYTAPTGEIYEWNGYSWVTSGSSAAEDPNLRFVNVIGDNMTGDLTLGTDKITLRAGGSAIFSSAVGINGAAGLYPLHVQDTIAVTNSAQATLFSSGSRADLILRSTDSVSDQQRQVIRSRDDSLVFGTENSAVTIFTEKARITDAGNLLIGGTLPSSPNIALNANGRIVLTDGSGPSAYLYPGSVARFQLGDTSASDNSMFQVLAQGSSTQASIVASDAADTDPTFTVSSRAGTTGVFNRTFAVTTDGSVSVGGSIDTLPGTPNISLNAADGNITTKGSIFYGATGYIGDDDLGLLFNGTADGTFGTVIGVDPNRATNPSVSRNLVVSLNPSGGASRETARFTGQGDFILGKDPNTSTAVGGIKAYAGGAVDLFRASTSARSSIITALSLAGIGGTKEKVFSVDVDGEVRIGGDIDVSPNIRLQAAGSAEFSGTVTSAGSFAIQLEADDDTKYTATTDAEGNETRVYNGEVLDVKALLLTLQTAASRIATLEAKVQTLESDHTTLMNNNGDY